MPIHHLRIQKKKTWIHSGRFCFASSHHQSDHKCERIIIDVWLRSAFYTEQVLIFLFFIVFFFFFIARGQVTWAKKKNRSKTTATEKRERENLQSIDRSVLFRYTWSIDDCRSINRLRALFTYCRFMLNFFSLHLRSSHFLYSLIHVIWK